MNQQQQKLNQLFNRFAQETQASSFAMENLLNKTIRIMDEDAQQLKGQDINNKEG
jgi:hypothetical protein